ncbi:UNVERIFIED_CONTAM: putative GATA transcription factor 22 [Sesamum latifolium]|uniref:GATA transcription factor 22 n=2 Tax=Sesamum TaxID=4181 RepID=A0AAW2VF74_9LAMI
MNLNSSPSLPFPIEQNSDDDHHHQPHQPFAPNPSPSVSCHIFFNSTTHQDHTGYSYDRRQLYHPQHHSDDNYGANYHGGSTCEIKNKVEGGLKLTLWKKEDEEYDESIVADKSSTNPVKWMSSKMRLMHKMKNPTTTTTDRVALKISSGATGPTKLEDQKLQPSSSLETDLSSNSFPSNNNSPIRVCADCNTTKTPLWRSGPKGPKSLCNACGIRQRKARRAMAAAAAAANGSPTDQPPAMKIKVQHKEKTGKNGHATQLKKRCKTTVATTSTAGSSSPSNGQKKLGFEDFLINLSKNLAFHRVFPEDEKDAAILLMALSSGLLHG